jgi:hypothetical protein
MKKSTRTKIISYLALPVGEGMGLKMLIPPLLLCCIMNLVTMTIVFELPVL